MSIMAWVLGVAAILLLLFAILQRAGFTQGILRKKIGSPKQSYMEEFADELAGDFLVAPTPYPKTKPQHPEIPWQYGADRLVLMVRDPNWLFAYWEITAAKQDEFSQQYGQSAWGSSRPVLRVYDVTGVEFNGSNANNYIDYAISDYVDNWHLEVSRPNSTLCVDVGRVFPDGRFVTLLRSNIVHTPSMEVSNLVDEEWMWIDGIYRTITRLHPGSSPLMMEDVSQRMGLVPLGISSPEFTRSANNSNLP